MKVFETFIKLSGIIIYAKVFKCLFLMSIFLLLFILQVFLLFITFISLGFSIHFFKYLLVVISGILKLIFSKIFKNFLALRAMRKIKIHQFVCFLFILSGQFLMESFIYRDQNLMLLEFNTPIILSILQNIFRS